MKTILRNLTGAMLVAGQCWERTDTTRLPGVALD